MNYDEDLIINLIRHGWKITLSGDNDKWIWFHKNNFKFAINETNTLYHVLHFIEQEAVTRIGRSQQTRTEDEK